MIAYIISFDCQYKQSFLNCCVIDMKINKISKLKTQNEIQCSTSNEIEIQNHENRNYKKKIKIKLKPQPRLNMACTNLFAKKKMQKETYERTTKHENQMELICNS